MVAVRVGAHLSIGGGWAQLITDAVSLGCETVQIFSRSPRGGKARSLGEGEVAVLREGLARADLHPLIVHTPYLVNIGAPEESKWEYAVSVLAEDLTRAALLGSPWVVVHMGHARGLPPEEGLLRCVRALDTAVERAGAAGEGVTILLENTAGGLGASVEALATVISAARHGGRLGLCLDTCHAFAAGYDLRLPSGQDDFLGRVRGLVGSDRIRVWHFNDSVGDCGSHLDRHEHLGQGRLGRQAFALLLAQPELDGRPVILETPVKGPEGYRPDLSALRELREGG
ncbi:MAG: deoxyribonuclease IV [Bacillota bacterium]|nr:deoxyribonuclease IV [Bacillota bacterium]MDI7249685.1 deoxyribonuclease IV [Bacillota bacterium]